MQHVVHTAKSPRHILKLWPRLAIRINPIVLNCSIHLVPYHIKLFTVPQMQNTISFFRISWLLGFLLGMKILLPRKLLFTNSSLTQISHTFFPPFPFCISPFIIPHINGAVVITGAEAVTYTFYLHRVTLSRLSSGQT